MAFFSEEVDSAPPLSRRTVTRAVSLSTDLTYRYSLTRLWDPKLPRGYFIMLNPSYADGDVDDQTVRKCMGFCDRWQLGGLKIGNLFAYRSMHPEDLNAVADPKGPENDRYLRKMLRDCRETRGKLVVAWGAHAPAYREEAVRALIREAEVPAFCLGLTKHGQPLHPVRIAYATPLQSYPLFRDRARA